MTSPVLTRRPEPESAPSAETARAVQLFAERESPHAPVNVESKADVRARTMRNATAGATEAECSQVKAHIESALGDQSLRGASPEERQLIIQRQVAKATQTHNLSEAQARAMREHLMDVEQAMQAKRAQELEETVSRLALATAAKPLDPITSKEDLKSAFKEIQKVAGPATSHEDLKKIADRFDLIREAERQAMMYRELAALGQNSAVLGSGIDVESTKSALNQIRARYPDVEAKPEEMHKAFKSFYESAYDQKLNECGFFSRQYYRSRYAVGATASSIASCFSWVGDAAEGGVNVVKGAYRLGAEATSWAAKQGVRAGQWVGGKIVDAADATADFAVRVYNEPGAVLLDAKNLAVATGEVIVDSTVALAKGAKDAVVWTAETSVAVLKGTKNVIFAVGAGLVHTTVALGGGLIDVAQAALFSTKSWKEVGEIFSSRLGMAAEHFNSACGVVAAGSMAIWHTVKTFSDSLGASGALEWITDKTYRGLKAVGLYDLGAGFFKTGVALGYGLMGSVEALFGAKSWSEVKREFSMNFSSVGESFQSAWSHASGAAKVTWGVVKGISDSLGISDLLVGGWHAVTAIPHLAYDFGRAIIGDLSWSQLGSNFMGHLKGIGIGLVGGLVCLGEITGIFDLGRAIKHGTLGLEAYGRYADKEAAQHAKEAAVNGTFAALSIGSITATVATGGAAASSVAAVAAGRATLKEAGKAVLKTASKEFLEKEAKEIGKAVVSDMSTAALGKVTASEGGAVLVKQFEEKAAAQLGASATKESQQKLVEELALKHVLQREAVASATETAQKVAAEVSTKGADVLSKDLVEQTAKEVSTERTAALLKELKLTDSVDKLTYEMLVDIKGAKPKEAAEKLMSRYGVPKSEADAMVKEMQKALKTSASDPAMKQILEDGITKHVTEVLEREMKDSYKSTFKKAVTGQLDEVWSKELREATEIQAKRLGKTFDSYADELTEAAWKGAREGIEKATRQAVREGIERAFKRFRDKGLRGGVGSGGSNLAEHGNGDVVDDGFELMDGIAEARRTAKSGTGGEEVMSRHFEVTTLSGDKVMHYERFDPASNKWIRVGSETVSLADPAKKAA